MTATYGLSAWFPEIVDDERCRLMLVDRMIEQFPDAMLTENGGPHVFMDEYGIFPGMKRAAVVFTSEVDPSTLTQDQSDTYTSIFGAAIDRIRRLLNDEKEQP